MFDSRHTSTEPNDTLFNPDSAGDADPGFAAPLPRQVGVGLALLFWSPLRARLHRVPKAWTRSGRAARSAPAALIGKSSRRA